MKNEAINTRIFSKLFITVTGFTFVLLFGLLSMVEKSTIFAANASGKNLEVTYNLSGQLLALKGRELVIMFSSDMKALGEKRDGSEIVSIRPLPPGKFIWRGNSTLVFKPSGEFPFSTRFRVTVPRGVKARDGQTLNKKVSWEFSTPTPVPVTVTHGFYSTHPRRKEIVFRNFEKKAVKEGGTYGDIHYREPLVLTFNQDVVTEIVKKHLLINHVRSGKAVAFDITGNNGNTVNVTFTEPLERGGKYKAVLSRGIRGTGGNIGSQRQLVFYLSVVQPFSYLGERAIKIANDQTGIILDFSNPPRSLNRGCLTVTRHNAKGKQELRHLFLKREFMALESGRSKIRLDIYDRLDTGDRLSIRLKKNLVNIFDESIEPTNIEVTVCNGTPVRDIETGTANGDNPFGIRLQNIDSVTLNMFKLDNEFLHFLKHYNLSKQVIVHPRLEQPRLYNEKNITITPGFPKHISRFFPLNPVKNLDGNSGFFGFRFRDAGWQKGCGESGPRSHGALGYGEDRRWWITHRRDHDFIVTVSAGSAVIWAYRTQGKEGNHFRPLPGAGVSIIRGMKNNGGKTIEAGKTDHAGMLFWDAPLKYGDIIVVKDPGTGEIAFYYIGRENLPEAAKDLTMADISSDRHLYRPGDKVHIFGGVRHRNRFGELLPVEPASYGLIISQSKDDKKILETDIRTGPMGTFQYTFETTEKTPKGEYRVHLVPAAGGKDKSGIDIQLSGAYWFKLDHYRADTFKVWIKNMEQLYVKGSDKIPAPVIAGSFLSGNPMAGESLQYTIGVSPGPAYRFLEQNRLTGYDFGLAREFTGELPYHKHKAIFNSQGRCKVKLSGLDTLHFPASIRIEASAVSREGKEIIDEYNTSWFPGHRVTGILLKYETEAGLPCPIRLKTIGTDGRPAAADADVTVMFIQPHNWRMEKSGQRKMDVLHIDKNIRIDGNTGNKVISFTPPRTGIYLVKVDTRDSKGNVASTSSEFTAVRPYAWNSEGFYCKKENHSIKIGDTFTFRIHGKVPGKALVTIDKGKFLDARVVEFSSDPEGTPVSFKTKPSYFPYITVTINAMFPDGSRNRFNLDYTVLSPDRKLDVSLTPSSSERQPGAESTVDIRVKNRSGQGKKAHVFIYAVNEGNLNMSGYRMPDMHNGFYCKDLWQMSFKPGQMHSRSQRLLELDLYSHIRWLQPGRILEGRVIGDDGKPLKGARVMVIFNKFGKKAKAGCRSIYTDQDGKYYFGPISKDVFLYPDRRNAEYARIIYAKEGFQPYVLRLNRDLNVPPDVSLVSQSRYRRNRGSVNTAPNTRPAAGSKQVRTLPGRGGGAILSGEVFFMDGSLLPGSSLILEQDITGRKAYTVSGVNGKYRFQDLPPGIYTLKAELAGFNTITRKNIIIDHFDEKIDLMMSLAPIKEAVLVTGVAPTYDRQSSMCAANLKCVKPSLTPDLDSVDFSSMLRKNFRDLLFFKSVETDENGTARVSFRAFDTITTYRIMAVACTADSFGSASERIRVTKPMVLEEAVPEFARCGDKFTAGFRIGNNTENHLTVGVQGEPVNDILTIAGKKEKTVKVPAGGNSWIWFHMEAPQTGTGELRFYASAQGGGTGDSNRFTDALVKKIPVYPSRVSESLLDFDAGDRLKKAIKPVPGVNTQTLQAQVSPTLLQPAAKIRGHLLRYPYGCLEQQTSKLIPWVVLSRRFLEHTAGNGGLHFSQEQLKKISKEYIAKIRNYMHTSGGLCYYPGSRKTSHYLTVYVLWCVRMIRKNFPDLDTAIENDIRAYLESNTLEPVSMCFFQYVKSIDRDAEQDILKRLFTKRMQLPLTARAFLYRAIHKQGIPDAKNMTRVMLAEIKNRLMIETDFAYFDKGKFIDHYHYPFYSSRFVTAIVLQAILEVEHRFDPAPRIMRWLLEAAPYAWMSTQTNFQVLYAADLYHDIYEKDGKGNAVLKLLGESHKKTFSTSDTKPLNVKKSLDNRKEEFTISLQANRPVYLTTQLDYHIADAPAKNHGFHVERIVYDQSGERVNHFEKGKRYMVELLITPEKEIPYGVVDEPLAAGFEVLRQDMETAKRFKPFNNENGGIYTPWLWKVHEADRIVFYSYFVNRQIRIVYYIKALYRGSFTWLPTQAQGMYHPQYFGRTAIEKVDVR